MRKRIAELDFLRAVAAFAVVMIHVTAYPLSTLPVNSRSFFWYSLVNQWSRFSIPAFVLITGIVLFHTYGRQEEFRTGPFLLKRLRAIAVPYLVWSLLYMLWRAKVEGALGRLLQNLFLALLQGNAMYQLYFIVLIFQFYLLFPLIRPLGRSRWLGWITAALVAFQAVLMWDVYYGLYSPHVTAPWVLGILRWQDRLFPWWIGFHAVGIWIAANADRVLAFTRQRVGWLMAAAGGMLVWMMAEYMRTMARPGMTVGFAATGFRPTAYLYAMLFSAAMLGLGGAIVERGGWLHRLLLELGKHSFGIFLIHPAVLEVTTRLVRPLGLTPPVHLVLVGSVVMAGSYMATRLIAALPFGHWIVGKS